MLDIDLEYLREALERAEFHPQPWDGEDKNIGAFRSKEELIAWFCQPPGIVNQPYRDRAFYTRELAMLSRIIQPRVIVEFGTCQGIGTCLLRWLNPTAQLFTIDISGHTFIPGDHRVPTAYLALHQELSFSRNLGNSWEFEYKGVDLCFIDADHSYGPVIKDSIRAWENHSLDHKWAIAWHDHNDRHPGVVQAVKDFCCIYDMTLQSREDSDTVWVIGGSDES